MAQHTGGQTRRRGAALEAALLDAAWAELQSVGYAALTMEAVAGRAGTSRAVIYRRWRNRPELVIAAMRRHLPMLSGDIPDTGSLRGDVLAVLRRESQRLAQVGPETVYGLLGEYLSNADAFGRVQDEVLHIGAGVMTAILNRAAARGEARPGVPLRVATLPTDLFRHELFRYRTPPGEQVIEEIVDEVFLPLVAVSAPAGGGDVRPYPGAGGLAHDQRVNR
ncbi:TetR/AcrR family transcriptional regulator [Trebonia sp.]|uniref:TetR/AcrR family transcriptional regulator n=1 Tax=Trebonia sp. TaxID=2767075 RepID=UPI00261A93A6|nr:TetR/AcrR family transcriptional regulator [Trebonia sp.]